MQETYFPILSIADFSSTPSVTNFIVSPHFVPILSRINSFFNIGRMVVLYDIRGQSCSPASFIKSNAGLAAKSYSFVIVYENSFITVFPPVLS